MPLTYPVLKIAGAILKKHFPDRDTLSINEIDFFLDEFLNNSDSYENIREDTEKIAYRNFRDFVEYCFYRNLANFDSMILLSSEKGTGKSSAAMMLGNEWCKIIGIKFNPERHMAYSNNQVLDKVKNLNPFEPLICDEAIRFASSEDWNKAENKELKKVLGQVRTKHLLYILCFPLKIKKVDKVYLEAYVNYWIDLFGRGVGALYVKDKNPYYDSWRMKEFEKIGSYTEFTQLTKVKTMLAKHPNFWQVLKFPKPAPKLYDAYLKIREYNVYDDSNILNTMNKYDVIRALLLVTLKEMLSRDSSLSVKRLLMHLENIYQTSIDRSTYDMIMEDAAMLSKKVKENNLGRFLKD